MKKERLWLGVDGQRYGEAYQERLREKNDAPFSDGWSGRASDTTWPTIPLLSQDLSRGNATTRSSYAAANVMKNVVEEREGAPYDQTHQSLIGRTLQFNHAKGNNKWNGNEVFSVRPVASHRVRWQIIH